jgi:RNA polymerase sigma-70 factor, ECF subfamily
VDATGINWEPAWSNHPGEEKGPETATVDADRGLVTAAAGGSREAFDELVLQYQVKVLNLVRAMTAADGDAEDLAQEVFVRAWRSIGTFRSDSTFRTWIFGIAINVVRTHRGKRSRLRRLFWSPPKDSDVDVDPLEPASVDDGIEAPLAMREVIDKALATLPDEMREAVVLRDVQGLDYREIAEALGLPLGTVESRIFRGRQRLRPLLEPLLKK